MKVSWCLMWDSQRWIGVTNSLSSLLWDLTLTGVNKDEKLFQFYYEVLTLIGVDMSNESSWKPLDVYYEIWHSQGWRGLKIPFKPIVGSDISRHSQGWIGKEEIKFMITTWDLFHKQTNQNTQVSGLNYMRGQTWLYTSQDSKCWGVET